MPRSAIRTHTHSQAAPAHAGPATPCSATDAPADDTAAGHHSGGADTAAAGCPATNLNILPTLKNGYNFQHFLVHMISHQYVNSKIHYSKKTIAFSCLASREPPSVHLPLIATRRHHTTPPVRSVLGLTPSRPDHQPYREGAGVGHLRVSLWSRVDNIFGEPRLDVLEPMLVSAHFPR